MTHHAPSHAARALGVRQEKKQRGWGGVAGAWSRARWPRGLATWLGAVTAYGAIPWVRQPSEVVTLALISARGPPGHRAGMLAQAARLIHCTTLAAAARAWSG